MNFVQYVNRSSDLINLLAVLVFVTYYKRSSVAAKLILLHVALLFVVNFSASVLAKYAINNYFLLHILTVIDLVVVGIFYFRVVKFRPIFQIIIIALLLSILAFCLVDSLWISGVKRANVYSVTLAGAFKIFLVICFFVVRIQNIVRTEQEALLQREFALQDIFSISLLLYTASSMFFFLFLNILAKANILEQILYVNAFFYLLSTGISFYGIWRYSRRGRDKFSYKRKNKVQELSN